MIPHFNKNGSLPIGIYKATLKEIQMRFGSSNKKRKLLFNGLKKAVENLAKAGIIKIYVNGSFITTEGNPQDIDGCWDISNLINEKVLDPVFLDFSNNRKKMKEKYCVDFFIANNIEGKSGYPFLDFFQISRDGDRKGIVLIDLRGEIYDKK